MALLRGRRSVGANVVRGIDSVLEPREAHHLPFHVLVGVHLDLFLLGTHGFTAIFDDAPLETLSTFTNPNQ